MGIISSVRAGLLALVAAMAILVSAATALPLSRDTAHIAPAAADVWQVHGCHRGVQRDYSGWHFHNRACGRLNAPPPGLYDGSSYRRYYRTPVCTYQCRFIGPVKTCQQVCR